MADSDDEYDRKRRDKFRGERTESYPREGRRGGGDDRRREDWIERDSWGSRNRPRTEYRDYRGGGGGRERYSPARAHDISPPVKRVRSEWDDRRASGYSHDGSGSAYGNYGSSWGHDSYNSQHAYGSGGNSQSREMQNVDTQPPMMSFKAFLQTQDDNITDDEAIKKYNEYKLEFKRQQLNEFFVTHKEEEWFKIKYHPEDSIKRKDEQMNALKNRVNVFLEFLDNGRLDKVSVDADQSEHLIRLLDAVVIRLEGGTEHDLLVLDEPKPSMSSMSEKCSSEKSNNAESTGEGAKDEESKAKERDDDDKVPENEEQQPKTDLTQPLQLSMTSEQAELQKKAKEFSKQKSSDEKSPSPVAEEPLLQPVMGRKRKREYEYESGSDSGDEPPPPGESNDMDDDEPPPPGLEEHIDEDSDLEEEKKKETTEEMEESKDESSTKKNFDESEAADSVHSAGDKEDDNAETRKGEQQEGSAERSKDETVEVEEVDQDHDNQKVDDGNKPRPLHRTASIFLRNLAPTITKQEVEAMCKRYPGFLRVAIADPQPERRWFRRGWVTFERQVNIKEICWNLNNIRLRDCELGAIVNRDLSRRIRTVNGVTSHRQVVRHDIKLSARIVHNLDSKCGLWIDKDAKDSNSSELMELEKAKNDKDRDSIPSFGLLSKNPVLKNITDYLIEEASAEEEELLGHSTENEDGSPSEEVATVDRDEALIKVLDKLLFYLRVVHSVDYYNHCEYPNEDEMPNRCGIMHARGIPPSSKVTPQELSDYCRTFEQKIASFLQPITKISDDEFAKLGSKDPDVEVEKFIQANTQELAKDKWLCPLSGKKFKGPEFVRKHIFNKHAEKVDEVKKEVEYFNNYLRDPKRPQLAEHPGNRQQRKDSVGENRDGFSAPAPYMPHYQYNYGSSRHGSYAGHSFAGAYSYNQGYNQSYSRPSRGAYSRGRGSSEYRPVIHYRDLDAPREPEEFI